MTNEMQLLSAIMHCSINLSNAARDIRGYPEFSEELALVEEACIKAEHNFSKRRDAFMESHRLPSRLCPDE